MAQYNKRRETTRRQLEEQLRERQRQAARRKQTTLIASIVGALLVVGLIIGIVVGTSGSGKHTPTASGKTGSPSATPTATTSPTPSPSVTKYPTCSQAASKDVHFDGVSVGCATQLGTSPAVTSKSTSAAKKLEVKDLVVGKGPVASPTATVEVQYTGVLYKNGTEFDSSWKRGTPTTFPLTGVVKGFTEGIGGVGKIPPMRVGGRRIMILPSSLGYGAQASGEIPANSSLVFVVDLLSVQS